MDVTRDMHGQSNAREDDWKQQAPYRIHEASEGFEVKLEASCHCGKVEYQLSRDTPLASKFCHCVDCQVQHGAPFQWAAIFHHEDMNFSRGYEGLEWYDATTGETKFTLPCKVRCSFCKSPIMDHGRRTVLLFPSLIKFKDDEAKRKFAPQQHIFYASRVMDIPDGLPKWSGMTDSSSLLEDDGTSKASSQARM